MVILTIMPLKLSFKWQYFAKMPGRQTDMTMWHFWQGNNPSARLFSSGSRGRRLCFILNASVSPGCSPTCPLSMLANLDIFHPGTLLSPMNSVAAGRRESNLVESVQIRPVSPGWVPCPGVQQKHLLLD